MKAEGSNWHAYLSKVPTYVTKARTGLKTKGKLTTLQRCDRSNVASVDLLEHTLGVGHEEIK